MRAFYILCAGLVAACTSVAGLSGGDPVADAGTDAPPVPAPDAAAPVSDAAGDAADAGDAGDASCTPSPSFGSDNHNCGRCGHGCLGGVCTSGACEAFTLGAVASAPLASIALDDTYVFVASQVKFTFDANGIWRVPKSGAAAEQLVVGDTPTSFFPEDVVVLGSNIYFRVFGPPANGSTAFGGIWTCPAAAAAPCAPSLVAAVDSVKVLVVDHARLVWNTKNVGLRAFTPPGPDDVPFRSGGDILVAAHVDGDTVLGMSSNNDSHVDALQLHPDGSVTTLASFDGPASAFELEGTLIVGTSDYVIFSAYSPSSSTNGTLHRAPVNGSNVLPCDYGGLNQQHRPYGIHIHGKDIFWTNRGEGPFPTTAVHPSWTNGSVVTCPLAGCCKASEVMPLWTGDGAVSVLTGDDEALYFATETSSVIWKVALP